MLSPAKIHADFRATPRMPPSLRNSANRLRQRARVSTGSWAAGLPPGPAALFAELFREERMTYVVAGAIKSTGVAAISQPADDIQEALRKARQMHHVGMVRVSIRNSAGNRIEGDELIACVEGRKSLSDDLQTY
jgi:hypothetical protein